jgi:hypothetical protein
MEIIALHSKPDSLASRAADLFERSKPEQKRELTLFVFEQTLPIFFSFAAPGTPSDRLFVQDLKPVSRRACFGGLL